MLDRILCIVLKRDDGSAPYLQRVDPAEWTPEVTQAKVFPSMVEAAAVASEVNGFSIDVMEQVDLYAERLVVAGDEQAFKGVFGTEDLNFEVAKLSQAELLGIYGEYIYEEGEEEPPTDDWELSPPV